MNKLIRSVWINSIKPIFIGWFIDENNKLFMINIIMDKICLIQRIVYFKILILEIKDKYLFFSDLWDK